jgi:hypothetical protein
MPLGISLPDKRALDSLYVVKVVNRLPLWNRNSKVQVTNFLRTATYMQWLLAPITGFRPRFCTSL